MLFRSQFGYSRYLIPLDLISSILILCLVDGLSSLAIINNRFSFLAISRYKNLANLLTFFLLAIILAFIQVPDWGRSGWRDSWFGVSVPKLSFPSDSIVLMVGTEPMSYVIPYFPPAVRFLRVQGNLFVNPSLLRGTLLENDLDRLIRSHNGSFYVLSPAASGFSPIDTFSIHNASFKVDSST